MDGVAEVLDWIVALIALVWSVGAATAVLIVARHRQLPLNKLWAARVAMCLAVSTWMIGYLFESDTVWGPTGVGASRSSRERLCHIHSLLRDGAGEALVYVLAFFYLRTEAHALGRRASEPGERKRSISIEAILSEKPSTGWDVIRPTLVAAIPVLLLHIALLSSSGLADVGHDTDVFHELPSFFYDESARVCVTPVLAHLGTALYALTCAFFLGRTVRVLLERAHNVALRRTLRRVFAAFSLMVAVSVCVRMGILFTALGDEDLRASLRFCLAVVSAMQATVVLLQMAVGPVLQESKALALSAQPVRGSRARRHAGDIELGARSASPASR